jgi:flagellar protein FlbD
MIKVTRINGTSLVVNALLIETVESTPDTMITLITGKKMIVKEPADQIVSQVKQYLIQTHSQRAIMLNQPTEE